MEESFFHLVQTENTIGDAADFPDERNQDNSSDDDEEFEVLTESSDLENVAEIGAAKQQDVVEVGNSQDGSVNTVPLDAVLESLAARPIENGELEELGTGAGLEDMLLNEDIINEDNGVEIQGEGGDDQDGVVNGQNGVEEVQPDASVQFDCPALDNTPVDQPVIEGSSYIVQAVVFGILFVCALSFHFSFPDPVKTPPKRVSPCFNPLTQCPATFVDHSVGTEGSWKVKYDDLQKKCAEMESALLQLKASNEEWKERFTLEQGKTKKYDDLKKQFAEMQSSLLDSKERSEEWKERFTLEQAKTEKYDDLKKQFIEMESSLLDSKKRSKEWKEKFTLERGRAEMFLSQYLSLKGRCDETTIEPDWVDCLNKFSKAAQDKLDSVPKVVEYLDNTVQAGGRILKSLGINVTEGLRLAWLKTLRSFTTYSEDDRDREGTKQWTENDRYEEHSYQSGGSASQPVYRYDDYKDDRKPPEEDDFIISGVGKEDYVQSKSEEAEEVEEEEENGDFSHSDLHHGIDIKLTGGPNEMHSIYGDSPTADMIEHGRMFKKFNLFSKSFMKRIYKMKRHFSGTKHKNKHDVGSCGRRCYSKDYNDNNKKMKANRKRQTTFR
jgi:hypothetical protein